MRTLLIGIFIFSTLSCLSCFTSKGSAKEKDLRLRVELSDNDDDCVWVTIDKNGNVHLEKLPVKISGQWSVEVIHKGAFEDLSDATCEIVRARAELASDKLLPELARAAAIKQVRQGNSLTVHMDPLFAFREINFLPKVRAALKKGGHDFENVKYRFPFVFDFISAEFPQDEGSLIALIGEEKRLYDLIKAKMDTRKINVGALVLEMNAMDLACDLKSGKVKMEISLGNNESEKKLDMNVEQFAFGIDELKNSQPENKHPVLATARLTRIFDELAGAPLEDDILLELHEALYNKSGELTDQEPEVIYKKIVGDIEPKIASKSTLTFVDKTQKQGEEQ